MVQDYLTVYDGGSTSDKVLVRLCGGDAVPDIVSSHNTMLLEFHTSPYDNPFHPVPLSFLPGFELEVQVTSGNYSVSCEPTVGWETVDRFVAVYLFPLTLITRVLQVMFVDEKSRTFVKENNNCDFYISSEDSSSGVLENPKHSLPPNTTCRYHFQGKLNEIVWLSFVKYYAASAEASTNIDVASDCNATLLIWDGDYTSDKVTSVRKVPFLSWLTPSSAFDCVLLRSPECYASGPVLQGRHA